MKLTKEILDTAKTIFEAHGGKELFVNEQGHFFFKEHAALASENGDKEKVERVSKKMVDLRDQVTELKNELGTEETESNETEGQETETTQKTEVQEPAKSTEPATDQNTSGSNEPAADQKPAETKVPAPAPVKAPKAPKATKAAKKEKATTEEKGV